MSTHKYIHEHSNKHTHALTHKYTLTGGDYIHKFI